MSSNRPQILVIDDDNEMFPIYKKIIPVLAQITFVDNIENSLQELQIKSFDLILLDLYVHNDKSFEFPELIEENIQKIILVTASTKIDDEIKAHQLGMCDFIRKPFNLKLATSIIEKHLIQILDHHESLIQKGPFVVNLETHEIKIIHTESETCEEIKLTPIQFLIFNTLLKQEGKVITKDNLNDLINIKNKDMEKSSRGLDVQIGHIRKKLKNYGKVVVTKRGLGHMIDLSIL